MQPRKIALLAREAASDKKAEEPILLDVTKLTSIANFFLIAHGNSDVHVRAIANNIVSSLKEQKVRVLHQEGVEAGRWILLDFGSLIVHVFYRETREFYGLERLWGEAPEVK